MTSSVIKQLKEIKNEMDRGNYLENFEILEILLRDSIRGLYREKRKSNPEDVEDIKDGIEERQDLLERVSRIKIRYCKKFKETHIW